MDRLIRLAMPDGTEIWARVAAPEPERNASSGQGGDVGLRSSVRQAGQAAAAQVRGFVETVQSVAASVHTAVAESAPSAVSVEFGLELTLETSQVVAVLAQAGAKTSVTVRLEWDRDALRAPTPQASAPQTSTPQTSTPQTPVALEAAAGAQQGAMQQAAPAEGSAECP